MQKDYRFNEERGCYEFCDGKGCDLQDQLKHGDVAHKLCAECIEEYEGVAPDNKELHSTPAIRKMRKEVPHAEEFISGVGTNSDALAGNHNARRGNVYVSRPDLDAIEAGDV